MKTRRELQRSGETRVDELKKDYTKNMWLEETHPPIKGKRRARSAFDDLSTTYINPFDGPPPKPKSSTLFIMGGYGCGDQYKTKEVKVKKGYKKENPL